MVKYMVYRLFLKIMGENTNVFVSGNSKRSMEIIDCLRGYPLDKVFFNWHDKGGYNIVLHHDSKVKAEYCLTEGGTLYIIFGDGAGIQDMAYILLSSYYMARSKTNGSYSNLLRL